MFPSIVIPLVAAMALAVAVTTFHRRLPPAPAARAVTVALSVVVGAAAPTLLIFSLGYLVNLSILGIDLDWCAEAMGVRVRVPGWAGVPSVVLTVIGVTRAVRILRMYRRLRHDRPGSVEIAGHDEPFAFTLPGRGGHVVLSTGLVELLDADEQAVVLAHERAHATHRHDRYLLVGQLAAAAVPMLRPLASRLQFSLERWADEAAADECGDRRFVARTLGKVALYQITPVGALSFVGLGVPARVAALLAPAPALPLSPLVVALWCATVVTGVLAAFQIHHLASVIMAFCPG